jgi:ABC-2 type transport system ATP-binding protein
VIEAHGLLKRYGSKVAVDHLSFTVTPGAVTGFLGPNGAGKSTTMRMIIGLDAPTEGGVTVNGKRYVEHRAPLHEVGALLEAKSIHAGRSARNHLLALAATHGLGVRRVDEVLGIVGLSDVAAKRVGGFSLGMGQRLGLAGALLADPSTLILDEPVNGLDPGGIQWMRNLLRGLAAEGRTVFVSSHLMSEMALTAERLVVIGRGRLIAETTVSEFTARASSNVVRVRTPADVQLRDLITAQGGSLTDQPNTQPEPGLMFVAGLSSPQIGEIAAANGVVLHELTPVSASLEQAFIELTGDTVEYGAAPTMPPPGYQQPGYPPPPAYQQGSSA